MTNLTQIQDNVHAQRVIEIGQEMQALQAELEQVGQPDLGETFELRITSDGDVTFYVAPGVKFTRPAGAMGRKLRSTIDDFYTQHTSVARRCR